MKVLSVFHTEEGIIVERKNEFGTKFKRVFESEEAMLEYLDVYIELGKLDEYELNVANEFWALVINHVKTSSD